MKSIVISFRVKPNQLARVLDGIWKQNPCFEPEKMSKIGKKAFEQGANFLIQGLAYEPSDRAKQTLTNLSQQINWNNNDNTNEKPKEKTTEELMKEQIEKDADAYFNKKDYGEII